MSTGLLAVVNYNYLYTLTNKNPINTDIIVVLTNILNELTIVSDAVELSVYERIRNWLTNPYPIYKTEANIVLSLGIDYSPPLLIAKLPVEEEFENGLQLNELRDLEICPGVLYTYALIENTYWPIPRKDNYVWIYEDVRDNSDGKTMLLEYIKGETFDSLKNLESHIFAAAILQTILTLWTINHRYGKIHNDLHSGNFLLRSQEEQWIRYQSPIGYRWIRSSIIATVIDYADLLVVGTDSGGGEVVEFFQRIVGKKVDKKSFNMLLLYKIINKKNEEAIAPINYYEQIMKDAVNIFSQYLDLDSIWSEQQQIVPQHVSYNEIINHQQPITRAKQVCTLKRTISSYSISQINVIVENFNQDLDRYKLLFDQANIIVTRSTALGDNILQDTKLVIEYFNTMVYWADDINKCYSDIKYFECISDVPKFQHIINIGIGNFNQSRKLYLTHLPSFLKILNYLSNMNVDDVYTDYDIIDLQVYKGICESIVNDNYVL